MKRRLFLSLLLAPVIPLPKLESLDFVWSKTEFNYKPHPAQVAFLEAEELHLYGVPYHLSNGSIGSWIGFTRKGLDETIKTGLSEITSGNSTGSDV